MVAPEDDVGAFGESALVERVEHEAELGVHVAGGGIVTVDEAAGGGGVNVALGRHVGVLAQLAAELPGVGGRAGGRLGDLGHGDGGAVVEVPVFLRGDEGEVRADEADGDEEGLVGLLRGGLEALHSFEGGLAVGIGVIGHRGAFRGGAARAVAALAHVGAAFGEGVSGGFGSPMRDGPGGGVLDVAVAAVEDLAHGLGAVALLAEVLRQGDGIRRGFAEVRAQLVDAEGLRAQAGHERVAGGGADGLVAIRGLEEHAAPGEAVGVGRFGEAVAIAAEGGLQIVHADEQDVRFGGRGAGAEGQAAKEAEHFHEAVRNAARAAFHLEKAAAPGVNIQLPSPPRTAAAAAYASAP